MIISEIMTQDVQRAKPDTKIDEVARMMKERDCGSIPVEENDRLIGMITDRDIVMRCVAESKDPISMEAREVMSPEILYCYEDEHAEAVARNMGDIKVRRLPVLNRNKRLVGIVSLGDISVGCEDEAITGETMERIRLAA